MLKKRFKERVRAKFLEYFHQTQDWLLAHNYLESQKNYQKFLIVCNIRTGSTMLSSMLENHPQAVCFFELFHRHLESVPFSVSGYQRKAIDSKIVALRNSDPVEFLKSEIYKPYGLSAKAVGFKLLYPQGRCGNPWWNSSEFNRWWEKVGYEPDWSSEKSALWEYLKNDKSIAIIHLKRENLLRSKVSAMTAQITGEWGIGATGGFSDVTTEPELVLDFDECLQDFEAHRRMESEADELFIEHRKLDMTYEYMTSCPDDAGIKIQKFLGLEPKRLSTKTRKQSGRSLSEIVANYDHLKQRFNSTPWHYLFDD